MEKCSHRLFSGTLHLLAITVIRHLLTDCLLQTTCILPSEGGGGGVLRNDSVVKVTGLDRTEDVNYMHMTKTSFLAIYE